MAVVLIHSLRPIVDSNGVPVSGALVYVYDVGTTTLKTVYSDSTLLTTAANPVVCTGGFCPLRYLAAGTYKVAVTTSAGVAMTAYNGDNIDPGVPVGSGALPVASGGTASTTAAAARTALGAASSASLSTTAADVATLQDTLTGTDASQLATGTTAQAPGSPAEGMVRTDTDTDRLQWYGSAWENVLTASSQTAADQFAGSVIQIVSGTPYTSNASLTTVIPADDTIPLVTEGTEVLTVSITPKHASSTIYTFVSCGCVSGTLGNDLAIAMFKNGGSSAVALSAIHVASADIFAISPLTYSEAPGSVSAITYSVRAGPSATAMRFNGTTSSRQYGGASAARIWCIEVRG